MRDGDGFFSAFRAWITAIISMRLLVVAVSPPDNSFSWPPVRRIAAQPPGPGFPEQAPSVKMSTIAPSQSVLPGVLHLVVEAQLACEIPAGPSAGPVPLGSWLSQS